MGAAGCRVGREQSGLTGEWPQRGRENQEKSGETAYRKSPGWCHTQRTGNRLMDLAIQVLQVTLTLENNFGQELGTKAWLDLVWKKVERLNMRSKELQNDPHCFVSALGFPLTVYILPRWLESGIKLQSLMFPLQSLLSMWRMLTLTTLNTPVHPMTMYTTS